MGTEEGMEVGLRVGDAEGALDGRDVGIKQTGYTKGFPAGDDCGSKITT